MHREEMSLDELVVELRKCAETDLELVQIVALACAAIVDREHGAHRDPAAAIRARFQLA